MVQATRSLCHHCRSMTASAGGLWAVKHQQGSCALLLAVLVLNFPLTSGSARWAGARHTEILNGLLEVLPIPSVVSVCTSRALLHLIVSLCLSSLNSSSSRHGFKRCKTNAAFHGEWAFPINVFSRCSHIVIRIHASQLSFLMNPLKV